MRNGPVEAVMMVYEDLFFYSSGIYQHVSGFEQDLHAVKIIGWGSDNGVDFWTVANSWNMDFGEEGFFRILRGVNECGIENKILAGIPIL